MNFFTRLRNKKIQEVDETIKNAFGRNLNVSELQRTYKELKQKYEVEYFVIYICILILQY